MYNKFASFLAIIICTTLTFSATRWERIKGVAKSTIIDAPGAKIRGLFP